MANESEVREMIEKAYVVKGPDCGRDKDGNFHCMCGKCTPKKISIPFLYLRARYRLLKNPLKLIFYEKNGKRYLIVVLIGLKSEKLKRRFEIVSEVDKLHQPIAFEGIKTDDCETQPSQD